MTLPNFLIVGAAKSGTTSLYEYLKQHPDIFMPQNKEPTYFSSAAHSFHQSNWIKDFGSYQNLFLNATKYQAIGEASVNYFDDYLTSIPLIKSQLGDPKIIILLKNPLYKTYSSYLHLLQSMVPIGSFFDFIHKKYKLSDHDLSVYNNLLNPSFYYEPVKYFLQNFSQVKILFFEEFITNPISFTQEVYEFLGVDKNFIPKIKIHNQSKIPNKHFLAIYKFLSGKWKHKKTLVQILTLFGLKTFQEKLGKGLMKLFLTQKEPLPVGEKNYLYHYFSKDIEKLAHLLKTSKPYSIWGFSKPK